MQLRVRSVLASGVSLTAAATIALAPLPTGPLPSTRAVPVALTGAWQELQTNLQQDVAGLTSLIVNYPPAPILTQVAQNVTTYSRWLAGQDGGSPLTVAQTIGDHIQAVAGVIVTLGLMVPLSFVGPFIAPGVMIAQLIADTAKYPSTPETVLQAFIDAPANYLNTTFNCCSTPLFQLAFGLLNPGPIGYLLSVGPLIAKALQITPPPEPEPGPPAAAARPSMPNPGVAQSRRVQATIAAPKAVASRTAKRPNADRKAIDSSAARKVKSDGKGQSARPQRQRTGTG